MDPTKSTRPRETFSGDKCFILDIAKERLEQAPAFDKDHWPAMTDDTWAQEVHAYHRARPYWE